LRRPGWLYRMLSGAIQREYRWYANKLLHAEAMGSGFDVVVACVVTARLT
jgi:hypothetical protein